MRRRWAIRLFLAACVTGHVGLVLDGMRRNFAGIDETAHIVAGLSHWQTGTFWLYRVNPPLPDLLASLPVLAARPLTDFSKLTAAVDVRPEWNLGWDFSLANRERFLTLLWLARLPGLFWSLLGAWVVQRWSRELYGDLAGCLATCAWCFDPTVLAWTQCVTGDVAAASTGVLAGYTFWRYLRRPGWRLAAVAGLLLGVALLTKFTLLLLFAVWPALALIHRPWKAGERPAWRRLPTVLAQLLCVAALGLAVLNAGYGFQGSFRRLEDHQFISEVLTARPRSAVPAGALGVEGNRFRGTPLGALPVPLPAAYLSGVDVQRVEFEDRLESYLLGEWRDGGWWYYYLVAFAAKEPLGTLALISASLASVVAGSGSLGPSRREDAWDWLLPASAVFALVSSQTGMNHHMRYVLPAVPFLFVGLGRLVAVAGGGRRARALRAAAALLLGWSVVAAVSTHPHEMSYFNEAFGGPENGGAVLNDSNLDWGQDLLGLKHWLEAHPEARPLGLAYYNYLDPRVVGIEYALPPPGPRWPRPADPAEAARFGPRPGWYAVSVNYLVGTRFLAPDGRGGVYPVVRRNEFTYFNEFRPTARAGHSIRIYRITPEEADAVRVRVGLPPLPPEGSGGEPGRSP